MRVCCRCAVKEDSAAKSEWQTKPFSLRREVLGSVSFIAGTISSAVYPPPTPPCMSLLHAHTSAPSFPATPLHSMQDWLQSLLPLAYSQRHQTRSRFMGQSSAFFEKRFFSPSPSSSYITRMGRKRSLTALDSEDVYARFARQQLSAAARPLPCREAAGWGVRPSAPPTAKAETTDAAAATA
ncbi:hypothetical protein cyc_02913 [Cyclospora cayetanensis]|uniref:Uncharacterized protein n=1 Tax=Cyclospora cayetanensis TaxID=88456 RepID=A0A1D3CTE8_9EIME|nr:hypothetical protein cyc_02913 [Cyclospora cayetanensis]